MQTTVDLTTKQEVLKRFYALRGEAFNGWMASWRDLSNFVDQKRGYFDLRPNRGCMINHQLLLDSHATQSLQTLASGLQSGMTSPNRPWHKWEMEDKDLNRIPEVGQWLDLLQKVSEGILNKTNVYSTFYSAYEELGQFGTQAFIVQEDYETAIRLRNFTVGEYWLGCNAQGRVDKFARYFWMTVGQMVEEYGFESCSPSTQASYNSNQRETWVRVAQLIEPNKGRDPNAYDNQNFAYTSLYWEFEAATTNQFLAKRGYKMFPVVATRWKVTTTDQVYGYGPGWYALGNIKQLQKTTLDKLLMQEKLHNPPMQEDASVEGNTNFLPGGKTKINTLAVRNAGVRPAYEVPDALQSSLEMINHLYEQIDKDFFIDIIRMTQSVDQKIQRTAEEWAIRNQDRIMLMGPVLYRIQEEFLDPFMELHFANMQEMNVLPKPPSVIQGQPIKVKYISILAQAQQAVGVEQINRVAGFIGTYAPIVPTIMDNFDWDEATRQVNELEGASSKLIVPPQQVAEVRAQRQKQEQMLQAQQMAQTAESAGKAAKSLSEAKTGEGSVLDNVTEAAKNLRGGQ